MRVALSVLAVAGCGFPAIEDEVVVRGRHVELHRDPSLPVCAEAIETVDRFVELVAELAGEPPADVEYYLYSDTVEACRPFGGETADCENDGRVYAATWIQFHELVHAATSRWGAPPAVFIEGAAVALGEGYPALTAEKRATARVELDSVAFFAHDAADNYSIAGDFVGYLIDRHGAARFRELARSLVFLADSLSTRARFRVVYGSSLDDAIADWRAAVPRTPAFPRHRLRCDAPAVEASSADAWTLTEPWDCPSWTGGVQVVRRTIDVATPGLYAADYELQGDGGRVALTAVLTTCDPDPTPINYSRFAQDGTHLLVTALGPGRHSLSYQSSFGETPATLRTDIRRLAGDGTSCATPTVYVPPEPRWSITMLGPPRWPARAPNRPDLGELWMQIVGNPSSAINATLYVGQSAQLCNGDCVQPTNCVDLTNVATLWSTPPGEPVYLRVRAPLDRSVHLVLAGRP